MARINPILDLSSITRGERQAAIRNLKRGYKTLQEKGWCQGVYVNHNQDSGEKTYCAWGSVVSTQKGTKLPDNLPAAQATAQLLVNGIRKIQPRARLSGVAIDPNAPIISQARTSIFDWNDAKGRQAKQVKAAFRAAIKIAENL